MKERIRLHCVVCGGWVAVIGRGVFARHHRLDVNFKSPEFNTKCPGSGQDVPVGVIEEERRQREHRKLLASVEQARTRRSDFEMHKARTLAALEAEEILLMHNLTQVERALDTFNAAHPPPAPPPSEPNASEETCVLTVIDP